MSLLVEIVVLVILLITLLVVLGDLPSPGARGLGPRRGRTARRRGDLRTVARVEIVHGNAAEVHRVLRPLLREIAAARLADRRIALDRDRDAARAALGDELWEIVRPGRERPSTPQGPGLSLQELAAFTDILEEL